LLSHKFDRRMPPGLDLATVTNPETTRIGSVDLSAARAALWLAATAFLALLAIYFVGVDQGAVSLFGSDTHVHEFFHDARHLLGFPCH
jgi:Probable cobalt transporter subunit (CbtB)